MAKYWLYNGGPASKKPYSSLADARKGAVRFLNRTHKDYIAIVEADSEPHDWLNNYKKVGLVANQGNYDTIQKGMFGWYVGNDAKYIASSGYTGSAIPKSKKVW